MKLLRHLPNAMTCGNLLCGCLGILAVLSDRSTDYFFSDPFVWSAYLIFIAGILDFLDGFVARLLKVQSPIGKELDSLADCVTFGVLPAFILYKLLQQTLRRSQAESLFSLELYNPASIPPYELLALTIAVFSALRLAKFNIDTRQSDSFIGVPTPANALVVASLPLILHFQPQYEYIILNKYILIGYIVLMSYLLVSELPLFALKFKSFAWSENRIKYIFLITSVVLCLFLQFAAVPLIILLYILLSLLTRTRI